MVSSKESTQLFGDLLFPKIFQTFRMSIQPTKLIITSVALAVICLAGWIMDFSKSVVATKGTKIVVTTRGTQDKFTELDIYITDSSQLSSYIAGFKEKSQGVGVFSTMWHFSGKRFQGAVDSVFALDVPGVMGNITDFFRAVAWALRYHPVYCIIFFIIMLAVISISGGAVCRIAALQFARGEKPGLTEALRYSIKRFTGFFTAPLAPIGIIVFIGLFIFLLGLAGNIPRAGELIVGIGMAFALFAGALIAVIVIGAVAGLNLMFPAVAYDGSDCFDAISRSFSYVYARPWRMAVYTVIAAVYGSICYTFVRFFAFLSLWITRWFLQVALWVGDSSGQADKLTAIWPKPEFSRLVRFSPPVEANWTEWIAAFLVYLSLLVIVGLVVSFIISFYLSANTIIYSLMRNTVDNTAREDIYMHFEEAEIEPSTTELLPQEEQPSPDSESQPDESSSQQ
ncbi:MAG TPA: hypothetical protein DIU00_17035 [Phycisphaerales bacterium]|nr:hypothetical protein [Phycisphaerales bacterium]